MVISGHIQTSSFVNIRVSPSDTSEIDRKLYNGDFFKGDAFVKDLKGRDWVRLVEINGSLVSNLYVANYISTVIIDSVDTGSPLPIPEPTPQMGVPQKLELVEKWLDSNGNITATRTTNWENPQVVEA